MQKHDFPLIRDDLCTLIYNFVNQLKIKHRFNNDTQKAGYNRLYSFLSRHPDVSVHKSEGLILARNLCMNRQRVDKEYFNLLNEIFEQNIDIFDSELYNVDIQSIILLQKF